MTGWPLPHPTDVRAGLRDSKPWIPLAAIGLVVLVTTVIAHNVEYGVAILAALCLIPVALLRLPLAIAGWIVLLFFSRLSAFDSVPDRFLLFLIVCWIGLMLGRRSWPETALVRNRAMVAIVVAFVGWAILSLAWAPNPAEANRPVKDLIYAVLGFAFLLGTTIERRHARLIVIALVAGATLSVLYGAAKGGLNPGGGTGGVSDHDGRLQAGAGDPNYLAAVLVPTIILAGGLAVRRRVPGQRFLLAVAIAIIAVGLAATQSRGGLIGAMVSAVVALIIWPRRRALIAGLIVLATGALIMFFTANPAAWHRIHASDDSGSGRVDVWTVARRIGHDHPIFGIGFAQFPDVSPHYVLQPGRLDFVNMILEKRIVVHNVYLELWVETGLIGLLLFAAVLATSIAAAWRAARRFDEDGDEEMSALTRTVIIALAGTLTASFFLSNVSSHQLWVLIALGPILAVIAENNGRRGSRGSASTIR